MNHRPETSLGRRAFRSAGFSLLEMIIAAGLVGTIAMMTASYMGNITDGAKYERGRSMQENLVERVRLVAASPEALRDSINQAAVGTSNQGNRALKDCMDRSLPCLNTSAESQLGFNLWQSNGRTMERVAGPASDPVAYDDKGRRGCDRGRRGCLFGAEAYWWATCPGGAVSCAIPDTVHVRVRTVPLNQPARGTPFRPYPANFDSDKTAFAVAVRGADINMKLGDQCRANEKQIGYDSVGRPVCRCVITPLATVKGKAPEDPPPDGCKEQICPTYIDKSAGISVELRMVLVGYDDQGRMRCAKPDQVETCWEVNLRDGGDCGPGAWMMRVDYGECKSEDPDKSGKGGTRDVVSCTNDKGTCCKQSL